MTRIATGLLGLLLLAEGTVWALPIRWDGSTEAARVVSEEMYHAGAAGPTATVIMGLTLAPERGAIVLLALATLALAVYCKRRRKADRA